jgi:hypothetical protein
VVAAADASPAWRPEGAPFRGSAYVGLMIGPVHGARVLEYNARFGDPETQVLLPLLESDPADLFAACARGTLEGDLRFADEASVGVVLAAPGYPDAPRPGGALRGLDAWPAPEEEDARATWCFHAGTKAMGKEIVAGGGRVLTMVARRPTLPRRARGVRGAAIGHARGRPVAPGHRVRDADGAALTMEIFKVDPMEPPAGPVREAAEAVLRGGVVAFPTDTVYGLSCSLMDPAAVDSSIG